MNKSQLTIFKEYEFDKPLIHKIDSIFDNCLKDCHKESLHTLYINMHMILNLETLDKLK